ncbi:pilus assembly protein [Ochrobactrum sp. MR28]|nr:pilus assembly protein [Ochrobactrum sp. MR28]MBX8815412.1 pilus assembly protein [Ochrobactrum sp. MR31]
MSILREQSDPADLKHTQKKFRLFLRDERGVTAVEFALVVFPFLFLMFAIIELGISFAMQQLLVSATEDISRQFYTGQLREENLQANYVQDTICKKISILPVVDCKNLSINLDNYTSFSEVPVKNLVTKNGELGLPKNINLGGPSTINQINVLYRWPVMTNILYYLNPDVKPADRVMPLFITVTWQNEPYS